MQGEVLGSQQQRCGAIQALGERLLEVAAVRSRVLRAPALATELALARKARETRRALLLQGEENAHSDVRTAASLKPPSHRIRIAQIMAEVSSPKPETPTKTAPLFTLAHLMEGGADATLTTHKEAVWSCRDTFHAKLNPLGKRTRAARLSPHKLCAAFEALAREHLKNGPPVRTCFCDTTLCASARGSASLMVFDQAYPGIYLTDDTVGLMALEPLQALVSKAVDIIERDEKLSAGVMLTPLTTGTRATDVLSGQTINDVFKQQRTGGTATRRKLYHLHFLGKLEFADFVLDIVKGGSGEVVVVMPDGSEYEFGDPDALLELEPHQIAVVMIEDGGASNKGVCRLLASVEDPQSPGERGPASCLRYDLKT